jgi:hypothetical protein
MLRLLKKLKDQPPSHLPCDVVFPLLAYFLHSPHESSSCIHTDDCNDSCVITFPSNKFFGLVDKSQEVGRGTRVDRECYGLYHPQYFLSWHLCRKL